MTDDAPNFLQPTVSNDLLNLDDYMDYNLKLNALSKAVRKLAEASERMLGMIKSIDERVDKIEERK